MHNKFIYIYIYIYIANINTYQLSQWEEHKNHKINNLKNKRRNSDFTSNAGSSTSPHIYAHLLSFRAPILARLVCQA